jgi:hypothetical protein
MATVGGTLARLVATATARAAAVVLGFAATCALLGMTWGVQDVTLSLHRAEAPALTLAGRVEGVMPGAARAALRLTLTNGAAAAARVTTVTATTTGVTNAPASCAASLRLGAWHGALTVPGRGSAAVTLPVALPADLPAACAAATWALSYTAY